MIRKIKVLAILLFFGACRSEKSSEGVDVWYAGALKNFMHHGDISAKASLDTLNPVDLYALGALENLRGELIVIDGKPYLSKVVDGKLNVEQTFDSKASLLVYSRVGNWKEVNDLEPIYSNVELENLVEEWALKTGLNLEEPFPFLLKGKIESFSWHVIDWPEGDTVHSHQKHVESGLNGIEKKKDVTILGFYSRHHKAIFTHHTTNMHLHVLADDRELAGHVDDIAPGSEFELFLPF